MSPIRFHIRHCVIVVVAFVLVFSLLASAQSARAADYSAAPGLSIPDNSCPGTVSTSLAVSEVSTITNVGINASIAIEYDDVDAWLRAPSGTTYQVHTGSGIYGNGDFSADVNFYNGQQSQGTWTLILCDKFAKAQGTLTSWTLCINTGDCSSPMSVAFTDGRLNNRVRDTNQTAAVYCKDNVLEIYGVYQGKGYFLFSLTKAQLQKYKPGTTNRLIKEMKGVRLYLLTSGALQINSYPLEAGKPDYFYIWKGCPLPRD